MYYLLEITYGLLPFLNKTGIAPKGYVEGVGDGPGYAIINDTDAMAIKLIDPEHVYILAYGPFRPMNIEAFEEYLPLNYCAPQYENRNRAYAMEFLLSKRTRLV